MESSFKYSKEALFKHKIALDYPFLLENINDVLENESKECTNCSLPYFENNELVINLDLLEKTLLEKNIIEKRLQSVDISFAILCENQTNMVLVELKLNVKTPNNIEKVSLESKVLNSKNRLGSQYPICEKFYVVFPKKMIEQARRRFYLMNPKLNNNFIAIDMHTLKEIYF